MVHTLDVFDDLLWPAALGADKDWSQFRCLLLRVFILIHAQDTKSRRVIISGGSQAVVKLLACARELALGAAFCRVVCEVGFGNCVQITSQTFELVVIQAL